MIKELFVCRVFCFYYNAFPRWNHPCPKVNYWSKFKDKHACWQWTLFYIVSYDVCVFPFCCCSSGFWNFYSVFTGILLDKRDLGVSYQAISGILLLPWLSTMWPVSCLGSIGNTRFLEIVSVNHFDLAT